ncbi:hypothetical protein L484_021107 [Morus notabilis]|uniref:Uncharacterized protein n=1 Tax=Morus notabilis TaxID=981085 RepID=W9RC34_9ROSA|nr:uncharacterized protein LOC21403972 [Morus notabilis]EXB63834.1 hypothetical protein L484_021107 [Morus notabilis]
MKASMAVAPGRAAKSLYNFDALTCLKWGSHKYVRCAKEKSDDDGGGGGSGGGSIDHRSVGVIAPRRKESTSETRQGIRFLLNQREAEKYDDGEEGIAAVREKLTVDFKEAANKLKEAFFGGGVAAELGDDVSAAAEEEESPSTTEKEARPWNLRKRKAAGAAKTKSLRIEGAKVNFSSPATVRPVRRVPEKEERVKFAVALSRKEIESDFAVMLGKRPPSRPKKRPRPIQRQLDSLFPGVLLGEITTETYKVPEAPKKDKTR